MSRDLFTRSCALLTATLLFCQAAGAERILDYHADLDLADDGSMVVTETITVRAEGRNIRRGIYRDFPTRYRDRFGNRVVVDFDVIEVRRDGQPEPWFTERHSNGVRLNTGDDTLLPVPAEFTYTLRYQTRHQIGFFDTHDELYWNVTGTGWAFRIDQASATITLPAPVPAGQLHVDFFTGPQGSVARNARAEVPAAGQVHVATTATLAPREGLTVAVAFPKGLIDEPTTTQRLARLLRANQGLLVMLAGLLLVLGFYYWQWQAKGRDPAGRPIFARYVPPAGYSPAGLRYLSRMHYDNRCFAADLVELAVKGQLQLHHEKGRLKDSWRVERRAERLATRVVFRCRWRWLLRRRRRWRRWRWSLAFLCARKPTPSQSMKSTQ